MSDESKLTALQAVSAVMSDLKAVGKNSKSGDSGNYSYQYRGIDDVINALAAPMREHGLVLVPHVVDVDIVPMQRSGWTETRLTVEYDVYGPDGSTLTRPVRAFAIGADNGDKGPGKAMSYAYKTAISQLFCLPTDDPKMDNEATAIPEPEPTIGRGDEYQTVKALFESIPDLGLRTKVQDEVKQLWGPATRVLVSRFDDYFAHVSERVSAIHDTEPFGTMEEDSDVGA